MSVRREFIWTCEACGAIERKHDYGFPHEQTRKAWRCVQVRDPDSPLAVTEHRCSACDDMPDRLMDGPRPQPGLSDGGES